MRTALLATTIYAPALLSGGASAADADDTVFSESIRFILAEYCIDCHSTENQKGDLDLERFESIKDIHREGKVWQMVAEQLELGEMPPNKKPQLSVEQKDVLQTWVSSTLRDIGEANSGDPGPGVVRRLSNAEYTYSLRDLTGIASLDPAHEFPVDGAAGEGFTNAGAALVMSPSLLTKYFDAAKQVAQHAVFLPDGIGFSEKTTRRDWTDEKLAAIRALYDRYTDVGDGSAVDLQGVKFDAKDAGMLPLQRYIAATLELRLKKSIADLARDYDLNAKYLETLWNALNDTKPSLLLDPIRARWHDSKPDDAKTIADEIARWQGALWRFASVGQVGKVGGSTSWQVPVDPLVSSKELRVKLPDPIDGKDVTVYLQTSDAGDGEQGDVAIWQDAKIVHPNRPSVSLAEAASLVENVGKLMDGELSRTSAYLEVLAESHLTKVPVHEIAQRKNLDVSLAGRWASLVQLGQSVLPESTGHYTEKQGEVAGNPDIRSWGSAQTPSLTGNASEQAASFSTLTMPGRSVIMHPSPTKEAIVDWRSPINGKLRINGFVADADGSCGNGVEWRIDLVNRNGIANIDKGVIDNGARNEFNPETELTVQPGDLLRFAINPRNGDHSCDSTVIGLTIRELAGEKRTWDLAEQVVDRLLDSNPLPDAFGNPEVWHFCAAEIDGDSKTNAVPPNSVLANWRAAVIDGKPAAELTAAAGQVQTLLLATSADGEADKALRANLLDWNGPLEWMRGVVSTKIASGDIRATAPSVLSFRIPAALAAGAELVTRASLHPQEGKDGSVQMRMLFTPADESASLGADSIIINEGSPTQTRIAAEIDEFRNLFPAALCYTKIVPADEVVTLTLFYREDHHLSRLLLDDAEKQQLERLWSELHFISEDALQLVDAFEQLWQFATQDSDPSALTPMREPINQRADAFRKQRGAAEPSHLEGILNFAEKAWRRPLASEEKIDLQSLYKELRDEGLPHDDAARLTLARLLIAPAFLYKLESPQPGTESAPVSNLELASRLSYFLWSSTPDQELVSLATAGKLDDPDILVAQMQRMLKHDRVRRLAVEFGSQWLHVRDFDGFDEKSERHFPEFAAIRNALGEEPVRFFTDLFQRDGSVLDLINADHTFVNGTLAKYYGLGDTDEVGWRRVEGVRAHGRGGVLGFGATLAKQSGASRTSPILRGAWITESLLGERLPRPPKDVPVLPDLPPEGLTERALTELHSSDARCARCHVRFDPYGFSLENFDAIGRFRTKDSSDLPINSNAKLLDGTKFTGIDGLRDYLLTHRRDDFVRQFSRKLVGYALGRGVLLSDEPLLDEIAGKLVENEFRISQIVEMIVRSRQFREIRGRDHPVE